MKRLKFMSVLIVFSLMLCMYSCSEENMTQITDEIRESEEVTVEIKNNERNSLSGEEIKEKSNVSPIGLVVKNDKMAYPQQGLYQADIVYEVPVEGGLTRFLAVYSNYKELPEIGPVIDSRSSFFTLANTHNALLIQAGMTKYTQSYINSGNFKYLDVLFWKYKDVFVRNRDLVDTKGYENSFTVNAKSIEKAFEISNVNMTLSSRPNIPFAFSSEKNSSENGLLCSVVKIPYSSSLQPYFKYSPESNTYLRYQYDSEHIDASNKKTLEYENVIIIFTSFSNVGDMAENVADFNSVGDGYYINGGKYIKIEWSGDGTKIRFYEKNKKGPLVLSKGKTFVCVCPIDMKQEVIII